MAMFRYYIKVFLYRTECVAGYLYKFGKTVYARCKLNLFGRSPTLFIAELRGISYLLLIKYSLPSVNERTTKTHQQFQQFINTFRKKSVIFWFQFNITNLLE